MANLILPTKVKMSTLAMAVDGKTKVSIRNSITKVRFCTKIIHLGQYLIPIVTVLLEYL